MPSATAHPVAETLRSFVAAVELDGALPLDKWRGKRTGPRRTLVVPVWVRSLSGSRANAGRMCKLRDVTDWGLGIRSQVPYKAGEILWVDLRVNNATWSGEMQVVHCTQTIGAYKVGLVLREHADQAASSPEITALGDSDIAQDPTPRLREALRQRQWLAQAKVEVLETVRAYDLACRSWGLLGKSIRRSIRKIVNNLPGTTDPADDPRRRHPRRRTDADVQVIVCAPDNWRRVAARITDVSENGVGLVLAHDLSQNEIERDLAGPPKVHAGMIVILGLGTGANALWVPAEIVHCTKVQDDLVRAGAQFMTPRSLEAIGKAAENLA